jgi:hypothetical protein
MKYAFMILSLLLCMPMSAWAGSVTVPEPGVLPLLAIGGVVAVAIKLMKRKK